MVTYSRTKLGCGFWRFVSREPKHERVWHLPATRDSGMEEQNVMYQRTRRPRPRLPPPPPPCNVLVRWGGDVEDTHDVG